MFLDIIKVFLFVVLINWTVGMHFSASRLNPGSEKITAILIALMLSILTGIVVIL